MSVNSVPARKFCTDKYDPGHPPSVEYSLYCTPPISTTEKDRLEVDDWLIQHDRVLASCSCWASSALTLAIIQGKSCVVRHLMERFPACVNDPDWNNQRPIVVAIEYRQHEILQSLLCDPHTNVNVTDKSGHTLLHLAVIYDDVTAVKILLANQNVDINARDRKGDTALLLAAKIYESDQPNSNQTLDSLLSHEDIRPEWLDYTGRSALWHAVNTCNWQLIRRLAGSDQRT
jgi:FOG: Ankyrin repeat